MSTPHADLTQDKLQPIHELARSLEALRISRPGIRIVHCHGVFDLLHVGHLRYLRAARQLGDVLVVTVTPDEHVNKGPHRPAFPAELRAEHVAALDCVSFAAVNHWASAVEPIKLLRPDIYVKGSEYRGDTIKPDTPIYHEKHAVESVGGQLAFTDEIVFSSSNLLNRFFSDLPAGTKRWLDDFNGRHGIESLHSAFAAARPLKLLVVGEVIIDEYQYCEAIGKSSKEPTLVVKRGECETFAGGILAVANNATSCCDRVSLLTQLGDRDTYESFCREHLDTRVEPHLLTRHDSPTIVKQRFVDAYFFSKLLEVYTINDAPMSEADNLAWCEALEEQVAEADAVLVIDFGHGLMTPEAVERVCDGAKFLAVNVQANAGNLGYNVIDKYPRADLLCIAQNELRLNCRDKTGDLHNLLEAAARKMNARAAVVTRGKSGCLTWDAREGRSHLPAVAAKVVDRVGAGDTFLSVMTPLLAAGASTEVAAFAASVAGAEAVATIGHRRYLDAPSLLKHVTTLLK